LKIKELFANESYPFPVNRSKTASFRLFAHGEGYDDDLFIPKPIVMTHVMPQRATIEVQAIDYLDTASVGIARTTDPGNPNKIWGVGITNGCCPWTDSRYNRGVWIISSPSEGLFRFDVFVASAEARAVQVQINRRIVLPGLLNSPTTKACFNLDKCGEWVKLGDVPLQKGQNEIWIERGAPIPHIRALRFVPERSHG
jgi:hypothetical protein